jgi:NADP-dependent 3-hydroxy acid dehydrogenase YdfG
MQTLADKVVVITGAGAGIGRALAEEFATHRARLALSDVNLDGLAETATLCKQRGVEVVTCHLDVTNRAAVVDHAAEVVRTFGRVNVVVNNAGVALFGPLDEVTWEQIDRLLAINVDGVVNGTKAFLPHLIASGDGHVVNLSSEFGLVGVPTQSAYCASKFFVRGLTEALRQDMRLAGHPVGVTAVHPGAVNTEFVAHGQVADRHDQSAINAFARKWVRTKPHHVARKVVAAVRHDRSRVLVGPDAYLCDSLARLLGPRYQPLTSRIMRIIPSI